MKIQSSLQFYVDKLAKSERFSLARFGDGELYCMWGKKGENSHGCKYTTELRQALWDSLKHKDDETFIYGLQRVLPMDENKIERSFEMDGVRWHDTEIFSEAVANGELYPLIEILRERKCILVAHPRLKKIRQYIQCIDFVETPFKNSYDKAEEIKERITLLDSEDAVFLFSCGMGANAIIGELHGQIKGSMLDLGHIWDPFIGDMSRCDLEGKTLKDIEKNLCPSEQSS